MILRRQPDGENVLLSVEAKLRSQVEGEGAVSVGTSAEVVAVDPDVRVRHRAVEFDGEETALQVIRDGERLPIPACTRNGKRAGMWIELGIERTFNRPVMRQPYLAPLRVVEIRFFGAIGSIIEKEPAVIEADPAFARIDVARSRSRDNSH